MTLPLVHVSVLPLAPCPLAGIRDKSALELAADEYNEARGRCCLRDCEPRCSCRWGASHAGTLSHMHARPPASAPHPASSAQALHQMRVAIGSENPYVAERMEHAFAAARDALATTVSGGRRR